MSATTPNTSSTTLVPFTPATIAQLLAAAAVAAGGLVHLQIWNASKREIPSSVPGVWVVQEGFLLNVAASLVVALALVATAFGVLQAIRRHVIPAASGVEFGSIAVLVLSRGPGIFGWSEKGYDADAKKILTVEIVAVIVSLVALALSLAGDRRRA